MSRERSYKKERKVRTYSRQSKALMLMDGKYICPWCKTERGGERVHKIGAKSSEKCVSEFARSNGGRYRLHNEYYEFSARWYPRIDATLSDDDADALQILSPEMHSECMDLWKAEPTEIAIQCSYQKCALDQIEEKLTEYRQRVAIASEKARQLLVKIESSRVPGGLLWRGPKNIVRVGSREAALLHSAVRDTVYAQRSFEMARWENDYVVEALIGNRSTSYYVSTDRFIELNEFEYAIERELFAAKVGIDLNAEEED